MLNGQPSPPEPVPAPNAKPAFKVSRAGWVALGICVLLAELQMAGGRSWAPDSAMDSAGYLAATAIGLVLVCLVPTWLIWRWSKTPYPTAHVIFFLLLFLASTGIIFHEINSTRASTALAQNLPAAQDAGWKDFADRNPQAASKRMIEAMDKQAQAGGLDGAASGVVAQFGHELEAVTAPVDTAFAAAQKLGVPGPQDDLSRYDAYIAADQATFQAVQGQIDYISRWSDHIDEMIKAKNIPRLDGSEIVISFKDGMSKSAAALQELYANQQAALTSEIQLLSLMKTNLGHWHTDDQGHRLFDDADAQKLYFTTLQAHVAANQRAQAARNKVIALEKSALQAKF